MIDEVSDDTTSKDSNTQSLFHKTVAAMDDTTSKDSSTQSLSHETVAAMDDTTSGGTHAM